MFTSIQVLCQSFNLLIALFLLPYGISLTVPCRVCSISCLCISIVNEVPTLFTHKLLLQFFCDCRHVAQLFGNYVHGCSAWCNLRVQYVRHSLKIEIFGFSACTTDPCASMEHVILNMLCMV